jgi:LPS export ABC transporter protein LptC
MINSCKIYLSKSGGNFLNISILCKHALFLFTIVVTTILQSCQNNIEEVNTFANTSSQIFPVESTIHAEILYSDSAKIQMKIEAEQLDRYLQPKPYFEMPKGVHVTFFKTYPDVESELKSDYAIGFNNINGGIDSMEVKRNVVVINEKGDMLNTEKLTWNTQSKKIYTNEFVKITTQDEVIWGNGLDAEEDFSKYEIRQVKGQINIKDSTQIQ